ncbi:hypothetical protein BK767_01685 [Bacillus thuringiensis serovar kyushuensis]|nr:hypothetical protein BK768_13970 [Bacillus thuringiensis serovar tohokuensis]OTZ79673.1 hypothetical protein BK767_01685 [Bacillus thuringiensis serovar kyushuensis]
MKVRLDTEFNKKTQGLWHFKYPKCWYHLFFHLSRCSSMILFKYFFTRSGILCGIHFSSFSSVLVQK